MLRITFIHMPFYFIFFSLLLIRYSEYSMEKIRIGMWEGEMICESFQMCLFILLIVYFTESLSLYSQITIKTFNKLTLFLHLTV